MKFNYHFSNNEKERTILLLHGFISDMESMAQISDTAVPYFNILRLDLPGFGGTRSTGLDYTMDTIAHGIQSILTELGLRKVDILGYSMGGRAALSFIINHPESVGRAILESSSPGIDSPSDRESRLLLDRKRADRINADYRSFIDEWEQMPLFGSQKRLPGSMRAGQRANRLAQVPKEVADSLLKYGTGVQTAYWDRLHTIKMPVLLIAGENDSKFISINSRMAEMLPDARFEIIEGAGHNVHMESPEKFGTIMIDFLLGG
ncbi:2-succinyl-6-hydroxy-2,4-cyclohexadiene-1-carboxylate synthase [Salinicoccus hispanicus]|uniref:Putative 2-succinyl-6-hydroxy-2,4-cyclohexadiene-1-carboxylate synthase n=1 Tax=Salinicoccus hispanicus TaxID=157225 RepID=A0A6N8U2E6_9STAP|nr:2-succinyl-6-hydroxy-2,4-cyclohexadiene-1-carboxylate synthase [Salinicoccus hispanicus]MXQ50545.1 2-succinyl-6-hydroxy-2,4-cyclohexadiene-1-carboxylate synthase [Salinicoccus hispanicus]